jgi:hypothetical protein
VAEFKKQYDEAITSSSSLTQQQKRLIASMVYSEILSNIGEENE